MTKTIIMNINYYNIDIFCHLINKQIFNFLTFYIFALAYRIENRHEKALRKRVYALITWKYWIIYMFFVVLPYTPIIIHRLW